MLEKRWVLIKKRDQTDAIYGGKGSRLRGSVPVLVHQLNWQKILVENKIKLTFFLFNDKKMKFSSDLISCNMGQFEVSLWNECTVFSNCNNNFKMCILN